MNRSLLFPSLCISLALGPVAFSWPTSKPGSFPLFEGESVARREQRKVSFAEETLNNGNRVGEEMSRSLIEEEEETLEKIESQREDSEIQNQEEVIASETALQEPIVLKKKENFSIMRTSYQGYSSKNASAVAALNSRRPSAPQNYGAATTQEFVSEEPVPSILDRVMQTVGNPVGTAIGAYQSTINLPKSIYDHFVARYEASQDEIVTIH